MQDYLKNKDFALDDKFKGKTLSHLKSERFSIQVRFFKVSTEGNEDHKIEEDIEKLEALARDVEDAILQIIGFPLNSRANGRYREIENIKGIDSITPEMNNI
jgi:hypothetical protein